MVRKFIVGVDVGGTNIKAALVENGRIKQRIKLPTMANFGTSRSIEQIKSAIQPLISSASGIGIGIAGIIDSKKGVVRFSPNFKDWSNVELTKLLEKEFKKPVKILNDVDAICLGEWQYGAARDYKNVFLFTLGTGVGGAAICEGKPLFGANNFAGEIGHTTIKYDGPKCVCGNYGCLERYVGARYIVALAKRRINKEKSSLKKLKDLTPENIGREANKGDRIAKEIFSEVGYYIGIGIANIVNLFDPDIIVISGGIARAGRILFEPIRKTVTKRIMGLKYRDYRIVPTKLADDAGVLGAVYYVSEVKPKVI